MVTVAKLVSSMPEVLYLFGTEVLNIGARVKTCLQSTTVLAYESYAIVSCQ